MLFPPPSSPSPLPPPTANPSQPFPKPQESISLSGFSTFSVASRRASLPRHHYHSFWLMKSENWTPDPPPGLRSRGPEMEKRRRRLNDVHVLREADRLGTGAAVRAEFVAEYRPRIATSIQHSLQNLSRKSLHVASLFTHISDLESFVFFRVSLTVPTTKPGTRCTAAARFAALMLSWTWRSCAMWYIDSAGQSRQRKAPRVTHPAVSLQYAASRRSLLQCS